VSDFDYSKLTDLDRRFILASVQASALRSAVGLALLAEGLEPTEESVVYVAKRMVEVDGRSLRDEVYALKSQAQRITSQATDVAFQPKSKCPRCGSTNIVDVSMGYTFDCAGCGHSWPIV
jgi:predicted RNA-binding Zn-ribbon protein involved in translation (DUF1610 family)